MARFKAKMFFALLKTNVNNGYGSEQKEDDGMKLMDSRRIISASTMHEGY